VQHCVPAPTGHSHCEVSSTTELHLHLHLHACARPCGCVVWLRLPAPMRGGARHCSSKALSCVCFAVYKYGRLAFPPIPFPPPSFSSARGLARALISRCLLSPHLSSPPPLPYIRIHTLNKLVPT
jgi:hypothetical protein